MNTRLVLKILLCIFLATPLHVGAVRLALEPAFLTKSTGETVTANLRISELGNFAPPSLGAFAIEFSYNPAVLSFSSASYGFSLGNPDPAAFEADTLTTVGPVTVRLEEISFLSSSELSALQPDAFSLANVKFLAIAPGISSLAFTFVDLADAEFPASSLIPSSALGSVVTVAGGPPPSPAPSPGTGALLAVGIVILGWFRLRVDSTPKRKRAGPATYEFTSHVRVSRLLAAWVFGIIASGQAAAEVYKLERVTTGPEERNWPSLNDVGDVVWSQLIGGVWQIVKNGIVITSGDTDKKYPSISNAGEIVYVNYGAPGPSTGVNRQVVLHPDKIIEFSSRDRLSGSHRDAGEHPDITPQGEILWYYDFFDARFGTTVRRLNSSVSGRIDNSFLSKDYPSCFAYPPFSCSDTMVYEQGGFVKSVTGRLSEPGSIPRQSEYGVVFLAKPDNHVAVFRYVSSLPLSPTSTAYFLDPTWPASENPRVIFSAYADMKNTGTIAFEAVGENSIMLGHIKAGANTLVAISAGHGRRYVSAKDVIGKYQRVPVGAVVEDIVAMDMARAAATSLNDHGVASFLPRNGDFISVPRSCYSTPCGIDYRHRVALADAKGAVAYIAIHTNALPQDTSFHGALLTRPPTTDSESKKLETKVLAALVDREPLRQRPPVWYKKEEIPGKPGKPPKTVVVPVSLAEYTAARKAGIPIAYLEVAFHTNTVAAADQPAPYPLNNGLLADTGFLEKAGQAIARGVLGYLVEK